MSARRVFITADHGLSIIYFLQSDVIPTLLDAGVEVVLLTDDDLLERIAARYSRPGLVFEGLRIKQAEYYSDHEKHDRQWWLNFLRRAGGSRRINTEAMDAYIAQVKVEQRSLRRRMTYVPMRAMVEVLRSSSTARKALVRIQQQYTPGLYTDLFDRYKPDMLIANTPGWRIDRYIMREASARGIPNTAAILGWDNPSSYAIPGAPTQYITCWSEKQKEELVLGSDWQAKDVNISGIPSYDGYIRRQWLIPREEYFKRHLLDPGRKLISYACSFETFSPNIQNIEALVHMVAGDRFASPSQLLVRLHPNHFMRDWPYIVAEREKIFQLEKEMPHVHVVAPQPLGGTLGYYSGEDMDEKSSMMAYSDVFVTVYSTMVVETAIHDRPVVSACIDAPGGGWNIPRKFSLALSEIGNWPTHQRFREAGAGRVAFDEAGLFEIVNAYLQDDTLDQDKRRSFVQQEITFTDGSAGKRTGEYLLSLL
jgi:CDP-glycerol glycerophosphotransferase (TagB/SpsB family)